MIDLDPFSQFIVVPDDCPFLSPVDEDVYGLKDLSSLGLCNDLQIENNESGGGLLLGPDPCHNTQQLTTDAFDAIAPYPNARENAFFPTCESSLSFPPALSPDWSPTSVASSQWPSTPETGLSLPHIASFTPVESLWDIAELDEELCPTILFVDQSGNNLEDIPSQVQDMMPEDIACTPQFISDVSLLAIPHMPLSNTPIFMAPPPPGVSTPPQTEAITHEQALCMSLPLASPHVSQPLFGFPPVNSPRQAPLSAPSLSPSLSPLSVISLFPSSTNVSPNPSPLINCSPLSPAPASPVPLSNGNEDVEGIDSVSSTRVTSVPLRAKRNVDTLDEDFPSWKISRRSKAKNVDEEEWKPGSGRGKRLRVVSPLQFAKDVAASISSQPSDESAAGQGSEASSDGTHTKCDICGQGFTRVSDYNRHIENSSSHPETRKVWPCPYCDSALGRKDALSRHIKTIHPGREILIPEAVPGSQKETPARQMPLRRPPKKDARRCRSNIP